MKLSASNWTVATTVLVLLGPWNVSPTKHNITTPMSFTALLLLLLLLLLAALVLVDGNFV